LFHLIVGRSAGDRPLSVDITVTHQGG
jgi:hypothetical protein